MAEKYLVTGNEMVSLPTIRESDGGLEGISFLHMGCKGMIEIRGNEKLPFLRPFMEIDGVRIPITDISWNRIHYWIPKFTAETKDYTLNGMLLAPIGERGFCYQLIAGNTKNIKRRFRFGLEGCWSEAVHSINESKELSGEKHVYESGWNHSFVLDFRIGYSMFAFAPIYTEDPDNTEISYNYHENEDRSIQYEFFIDKEIEAEDKVEALFWFGIGFEEVAAATSAKEMLRQGFAEEYEKTCRWLAERERNIADPKLCELLNMNMFFSFFFGSGITLDTEEFVLVTSRSPRYYVSAAYWDRDSLLWSFPAILMVDPVYAKEMLRYVFTRQIRNIGIHSRYIDGTVLEPGFELDELCAPVIALREYTVKTGDYHFLSETFIQFGLERILTLLASKKNSEFGLYETMLQPTDDIRVYRYITYDNVLVWRILTYLAEIYQGIWPEDNINKFLQEAESVREAIEEHCIKEADGRKLYAWSVDPSGKWDIYDEPPGSLQLLPHYGYCSYEDEVWKNTVEFIRRPEYPYSFAGRPIAEIGCRHVPHPWVLSIANSLLSKNSESALKHLRRTRMDNGIACESIDEYSGESRSGDAFATCAGFLAYAINKTYEE